MTCSRNSGFPCGGNSVGTDFRLCFDLHRGLPLPPGSFVLLLFAQGFIALMNKLADPTGQEISVKWHQPIWTGFLSGGWILDVIATFFALDWTIPWLHVAISHSSQRKLQPLDLCLDAFDPSQICRLHTVCGLIGGAATGTKLSNKVQQKNDFAGLLLQEGYELRWVSTTVDKSCELTWLQKTCGTY